MRIAGKLARHPEVRFTPGGKVLALMEVHADDGPVRVEVWEDKAEELADLDLQVGDVVIVYGRWKKRVYDNQTFWAVSARTIQWFTTWGVRSHGVL